MYKVIKSKTNTCYIYESINNEIFEITDKNFNPDLEGNEQIIQLCKKYNIDYTKEILKTNRFKKIEVGEKSNVKTKNLIIETGGRCNLACSYCISSGIYAGETKRRNVSINNCVSEKINNLIDKGIIETNNVSFYGGEPLMEIEYIKNTVKHMKKKYPETTFSMTTNGILLKDNIVKFLVDNKFTINVSVDGLNHDKYRRDIKGKATLRKITENLKHIKKNYSQYYYNNVGFIVTLTPPYDLYENSLYFRNNELFKDNNLTVNYVYPYNNSWIKSFTSNELDYSEDLHKLLDEYIENPKISNFHKGLFERYIKRIDSRLQDDAKNNYSGLLGCCVPGDQRLFIESDGTIRTCEKLTNAFGFGDICNISMEEFNLKKIELLNRFKELLNDTCEKCWLFGICDMCYVHAKDGDLLTKERLDKNCEYNKFIYEKMLAAYISINEINPDGLK